MEVQDSILVVVDVQGKLATLVYEHERIVGNIERLVRIAEILKIPLLWTEQAPDKIGPTLDALSAILFPIVKPMAKRSFSCFAHPVFRGALTDSGRRQVILTGIETHVCVYQTARDLQRHGYEVYIAADAVSSRTEGNKDIAIARMRDEGIIITSTEMVVTEWLGGADHPQFKDVMANIKR